MIGAIVNRIWKYLIGSKKKEKVSMHSRIFFYLEFYKLKIENFVNEGIELKVKSVKRKLGI